MYSLLVVTVVGHLTTTSFFTGIESAEECNARLNTETAKVATYDRQVAKCDFWSRG